MNQPILSICVPIYNRESYFRRMLESFLQDNSLFESDVELLISDNNSEENLTSCVNEYIGKGLKLSYYRQEINLGSNGNFKFCFSKIKGKYCWLLGSDDIPEPGVLSKIVNVLKNDDIGLLHIKRKNKEYRLDYCDALLLSLINVNITFMSANIFHADALRGLDLDKYINTWLIQVPVYINSCFLGRKNSILYLRKVFEKERDIANNGGFNFFEVFVKNLFEIYEEFVNNGKMKGADYIDIKRTEFKIFLTRPIVRYLIFGIHNNYKLDGSWKILYKYYGKELYAYIYLIKDIVCIPFIHFLRKIHILCQG